MSNSNTNLQTQTSNALHNAIMEADGKDRPPMLAQGNHVQWKSRIKRYIDTKPNNELIQYCLQNPPYKFKWTEKTVPVSKGGLKTTTEGYMENYKNVSQDIRDQLNAEAEAIQIILTGIDNDIYSIVDACPNACEMWKAIEWLKQEWQRFVTPVKQSQELKTISYHKLYDILKQHQNEVNEIKAKRIVRATNPLALVAQQQPAYHPQNNPTHYTHNSSTKSQQAATRNRGKVIVNSSTPTYDQEPTMVAEEDEMSKDKEIDKLIALISLSFKKIYKPTNNNLRISSNTSRANQDNTLRINKGTMYDNQKVVNVAGSRKNVGTQRDDTDDEPEDQELEAHYLYMAQIQEVTLDAADNSGHIFDAESLKKVQNNDDNYNVFAIESEHPKQPESINDTYPVDQDELNIIIDSLDMSYDREQDKEIEKIIALENKIKALDDIVYKTCQSVQTMNMLNRNCKTSFVKPEFLKKVQRTNPRLYDIGCYNDNLSLMLAPESDKTIRLA
ncbi:hypothetical protein Tco_0668309 [Tanacetum coccineum]